MLAKIQLQWKIQSTGFRYANYYPVSRIFGEKDADFNKSLDYGNIIEYFYITVELSNVVNKNDVASTVTQKLHGGVKMTSIRCNGAPKWHTKQN